VRAAALDYWALPKFEIASAFCVFRGLDCASRLRMT
jgi:hypothetical protein